jgi:uncharacterized protein YkwD
MSSCQRFIIAGIALLLVFSLAAGCLPNKQGEFTCILVPVLNKIKTYLPASKKSANPDTTVITKTIVQEPVIRTFAASPPEITAGNKTTLEWHTTWAATITIEPGIGTVSAAGSKILTPQTDTTYTITATNASGTVEKTVRVIVSASTGAPELAELPPSDRPSSYQYTPPAGAPALTEQGGAEPSDSPFPIEPTSLPPPYISFFTATPSNISAGSCTSLNWLISGASSAHISPGGSVPSSGNAQSCPGSTITYTLIASNSAGSVQRTVTVYVSAPAPPAVPPVISSFTASPASIAAGSCSTISWSTTGTTSASVNPGGAVSANGSAQACPAGTTTYTLTATNAAGSVTRTISVTIAAAPVPAPAPAPSPAPTPAPAPPVINSFTASPASVAAGSCATLNWSTAGATSVAVTPGGAVSASGSAQACPSGTTTYTLTATNAAGSVTRTMSITVTAAPPTLPAPADTAGCEQSLFNAVNALRANDGKAALTRNAYIDGLCRQHAQYMANQNNLSHDNVDSRYTAIYANVSGMHTCAENVLQANIPCNASYMANMWFNSPGHKTNMLNAAYTLSGMGIVIDANGKIWACQLFAGP